jgi:hypothetical protein
MWTLKIRLINISFLGDYDRPFQERSFGGDASQESDPFACTRDKHVHMIASVRRQDHTDLCLPIRPSLMDHFIHIEDEMDRNSFDVFDGLPENCSICCTVTSSLPDSIG